MKTQDNNIIFVATHQELTRPSYYRRLWLAVCNLKRPRRSWLDELANTFRDFDGVLMYRTGGYFDVPCVDEVFGNDPDLRWLGYFMEADITGDNPKMKTRKLLRLQLLDLYFRIHYPKIARHFGV